MRRGTWSPTMHAVDLLDPLLKQNFVLFKQEFLKLLMLLFHFFSDVLYNLADVNLRFVLWLDNFFALFPSSSSDL